MTTDHDLTSCQRDALRIIGATPGLGCTEIARLLHLSTDATRLVLRSLIIRNRITDHAPFALVKQKPDEP